MSNLKKFQALLIENGYDAAIISDQLNQHYLSGFEFHDGVVLVMQKDAYLITDFRYVEAAKENACEGMQVLTPEKGATDAICTLLVEHNCARVAIEEDKIFEEVAEVRKIFKFENTESQYNNKLVIDVHKGSRCVFELLFANFRLNKDEQAKIETPNYVVPACTVPQTCGKPHKEKRKNGSALAEDRNVKQIIAEEASE